MSGIVSYEPAELVLTAQAGTPMALIDAALAEHGQCLAFEPPDLAPLVGVQGKGTLGGVVATGLSGPRRFRAGGARDHVLGIGAVSGRGEAFVGGGKVVKNVTGYDIPKLMTGSYGTLAVLTEITMKVLPSPQDISTVILAGQGMRDAVRTMASVLQSAVDVSGACYLPAGITLAGKQTGVPATAFRLEGFPSSVRSRQDSLEAQLTHQGALSTLDREASRGFWQAVRDVQPFVDMGSALVWRVSVPPSEAAAVSERFESLWPGVKLFLDWGGGLIWVATESDVAGAAGVASGLRHALGETGGHVTLIRAPADVRSSVEVFQPQARAVAAIGKRVKTQFDPSGVLNPGRMYAGV